MAIHLEPRPLHAPFVTFMNHAYFAFMPSVVPGDGALFLSTSTDGLQWLEPVRILDGVVDAAVAWNGESLVMWQRILNPGTRADVPLAGLQRARSTDATAWTSEGPVFQGVHVDPGGWGARVSDLSFPMAWSDGERTHLYFLQQVDVFVDDLGSTTPYLGHAIVQPDGTLAFHHWIFEGRICGDGRSFPYLVGATRMVPTGEGCGAPAVALGLWGRPCGETELSIHEFRSNDGENFEGPARTGTVLRQGTVVADRSRALLYHATYDQDHDVHVTETARP